MLCDDDDDDAAFTDKQRACFVQTFLHITTSSVNHLRQLVHQNELLPTPFLQTLLGHLPFSSLLSDLVQQIITFVFSVFTFKPLGSTWSFHFKIFSLSAINSINAAIYILYNKYLRNKQLMPIIHVTESKFQKKKTPTFTSVFYVS